MTAANGRGIDLGGNGRVVGMSMQEQVRIALGAVTQWRDLRFAVKGFSGKPEDSYAKLIVRSGDDSDLVKLGLGETAQIADGLVVRLDSVPPPSEPGGRPGPTGQGQVVITLTSDDQGGAR